jgi:hypothetical protein
MLIIGYPCERVLANLEAMVWGKHLEEVLRAAGYTTKI